eukprot:6683766-Prymnesium_polylepis.2
MEAVQCAHELGKTDAEYLPRVRNHAVVSLHLADDARGRTTAAAHQMVGKTRPKKAPMARRRTDFVTFAAARTSSSECAGGNASSSRAVPLNIATVAPFPVPVSGAQLRAASLA